MRVEPRPALEAPDQQRRDRKNGGQRIGQHMQIGGADIAVMAMMVIVMTVRVIIVAVMMVPASGQEPGAGHIDGKTDDGDGQRLVEANRNRREQAHHALIGDQNRDQSQKRGACKGGKFADLAGTKRETCIVGMPARKAIGEGGNRERRGVGRHMPAIGEQRHRSEQHAGGDFGDHHDRGDHDNEPYPALVLRMRHTQKDMPVLPGVERVGVHARLLQARKSGVNGVRA